MKVSNLNYLSKVMMITFSVMSFFWLIPAIFNVKQSYFEFLGVITLGSLFIITFLLGFISLSFCVNNCKFDESPTQNREELLNQIGLTEEELKRIAIKKYLLEEEINKLKLN